MSAGYEESSIQNFHEKSSIASFSSMNEVMARDVDELLAALEQTTNEPEFLKENDDAFVKEMLKAERPDFPGQQQSIEDDLGISITSLGRMEPLALDEMPSDPNLLASLAADMEFQQNSLRLDDFVSKSNHSDHAHIEQPDKTKTTGSEKEQEATCLYPEMSYEPSKMSSVTGKRRRVPRRGSLPSMHLNYEDPYEPTPLQYIPVSHDINAGEEPPTKLAAVPVDESSPESPPGGHRRAQRRGSLPTMHLHYDATAATPTVDVLVNEYGETEAPLEDDEYAPRKVGRIPRRGSTGSFYGGSISFTGDSTFAFEHMSTQFTQNEETVSYDEDPVREFPSRQQGRMPRRGSTGSQFGGSMSSFGFSGFNVADSSNQIDDTEANQNGEKFERMQRRGSTGTQFEVSMTFSGQSDLGIGVTTTVPENLDPEKMMKRLQDMMMRSMSTQKALQKWDKDNGLPKSHSQTMVNTSRSRKQLQEGVILPKWDGTPLISQDTELGKPKPRCKGQKEQGGKMKRRMSAPASSALF